MPPVSLERDIDHVLRRQIEKLHRLNISIKQLQQLRDKGTVEAGDLMCKETTRYLVKLGYADTVSGSAASLSKVYITMKGQEFLDQINELVKRPWDG